MAEKVKKILKLDQLTYRAQKEIENIVDAVTQEILKAQEMTEQDLHSVEWDALLSVTVTIK